MSQQDPKSENLQLKKQLFDQQDQTKKLQVKLQRLTDDLKKTRQSLGVPAKKTGQDIAQQDLLLDLQDKVQDLSKNNSTLKQRLLHYQTLLSNSSSTGGGGKRPSLPQYVKQQLPKKKNLVAVSSRVNNYQTMDNESTTTSHIEELERLHELVHFLRSKLADTDADYEQLIEELKHLKSGRLSELEALLLKSDVEKLALQKRLNEIGDVRQLEAIKDNYDQLRKDHEQLQEQLHSEMSKRIQLEKGSNTNNLELIIEDLKKEKEFLRKQYATLLSSNKENPEIIQRDLRIEELETELSQLKSNSDGVKFAESEYQKKISKLNKEIETFESQQQQYADMKKKYDVIMEKLDFLGEDELNTDELDEAIAFMRLRREKGLGPALGMIRNIDEMLRDRKLMDKLRIDHLKCVEELEKTKELLKNQDKLTADVKKDLQVMKRKLEVCKGEYEIKLLENSKLLDARSHRISNLEGQLAQFMNGDQIDGGMPIFGSLVAEEDIKLLPGENLLEIKIESAKLFSTPIVAILGKSNQKLFGNNIGEGLGAMKHSKSCDLLDPAHNLVSFVSFDFFDFVTQVSRIAGGLNPKYGYKSRFKVTTDDFFVEYLSCSMVTFEFWRHIAGNSQKLAQSKVSLRDLLTAGANDPLKYAVDIIDEENDEILGQLVLSMNLKLLISDSFKTYKERIIVSQNLQDSNVTNSPMAPSLSKESVARDGSILADRQYFTDDLNKNKLLMTFIEIKNVKLSSRFTNILTSFAFYCYGEYLVESSQISSVSKDLVNVKVNKNIEIDVTVSVDLDTYLNNEKFEIDLFGEGRSDDIEYIGKAFVDLVDLTHDKVVNPILNIVDRDGFPIGEMAIEIKWLYPYRLKKIPSDNLVSPVAKIFDQSKPDVVEQSIKPLRSEKEIAKEIFQVEISKSEKVSSVEVEKQTEATPNVFAQQKFDESTNVHHAQEIPSIESEFKIPTFSAPLTASEKRFDDSTSLEVAVGDFVSHTISEAFNSPTLDEFEFPISPVHNENHDYTYGETAQIAESEPIVPSEPEKVEPIIKISVGQWDYKFENVVMLQQDLGFTHVFACIEFDGLPFEDLESMEYSAAFSSGGSLDFNFKQSFDFSGISMGLKLQKFLDQNRDVKIIIAGIRILDDGSNDEPVDIASCDFKLLETASNSFVSEQILRMSVKSLHRYDQDLGVLNIQISGLNFINEVCRVMEINMESIENDFHFPEAPKPESVMGLNQSHSSLNNSKTRLPVTEDPTRHGISSSFGRIHSSLNNSKTQLPITGSFAKLNTSLKDLNSVQQSPVIAAQPSPKIEQVRQEMFQSSSSLDGFVEHIFEQNP